MPKVWFISLLVPFISVTAFDASMAQQLPDLTKMRNDIDLGATSFFDGFGPSHPGLVYIGYVRLNFADRILDRNGEDNPLFSHPKVNSQTIVNEFAYLTPVKVGSASIGLNAVISAVNLDTQFHPPGLQLQDNGTGLSDLTFGPFLQGSPIIRNGRPVFVWRAELDTVAPVGSFNKRRDINQGSGYWSINPYFTFTYMPTAKTEFSSRIHYIYNIRTDRVANPPPIPGLVVRDGQAGGAVYGSFTASYGVRPKLFLGFNGYFLNQIDDDKIDGERLRGTKQQLLYAGPGAHISFSQSSYINLNSYFPVRVRNGSSGPQVNTEFVFAF